MNSVTLKSITTKIGAGATPTGGQNSYQKNGIALIRSQNVHDFVFSKNGLAFIDDKQAKALNNVTVQENDVLLNITGDSIARVCIVPKEILPARVNQHVSIIRCNKEIDSRYVHYYLQYLKPYLLKICGVGGTRNALTKEAIEKVEIQIRENHSAIAAVLYALDAKIELNSRINEELETMAKILYDYWFVQFDFPDVNGKPYKTSGGKMTYSPTLKREIPDGWTASSVSEILGKQPSSGKVLNKDILKIGAIPVIDQSQDYICGFTNEHAALITENLPHIIFGDHTRVVKLVNFNYARGADGTQVLVSKLEELSGYLLFQMITDIDLSSYGYARHFKFLKDSKLIVPKKDISKKYNDAVTPFFLKLKENIFENQQLTQLRDWLLPMLMNGQVKVQ